MFSGLACYLLTEAVVALAMPVEYVIDCSTWDGQAKATLNVRFEAWDGTVLTTNFAVYPSNDLSGPTMALERILRTGGWRYYEMDEKRIVVKGTKSPRCPVRSVTFTSDGWAPKVTRLPEPAPTPAPAPAPEGPKK